MDIKPQHHRYLYPEFMSEGKVKSKKLTFKGDKKVKKRKRRDDDDGEEHGNDGEGSSTNPQGQHAFPSASAQIKLTNNSLDLTM